MSESLVESHHSLNHSDHDNSENINYENLDSDNSRTFERYLQNGTEKSCSKKTSEIDQ